MINLTTDQIINLWDSYASKHSDMQKRINYYLGKHIFLAKEYNSDGSTKSNISTNFLDYIIDSHVSGSMGNPIQYVSALTEYDTVPFENLNKVIESNDLETLDTEHFKTTLITGSSVEVHAFKQNQIVIKQYSPLEWVFAYDTNNEIQLAIHKATIPASTIFEGSYLERDLTIYTVYDNQSIKVYKQTEGKAELSLTNEYLHLYGKVPVVIYSVNKDKTPFLNDCLINQNNLFSKLFNSRVDDIDYNVDSLLKITGYGGVDVTDETQLRKLQIMKQLKVFVLPDVHSDVGFISKGNETQKYMDALKDSRESLFTQAKVPDRQDVQGAIGSLSGVAIKHMYQPMIQQSAFFMKYFQKSLKERIDLINRVWSLLNYPTLEDYKINYNFHLPVDLESIATAVKSLEGIISKTKQLELIPGVNPQEELKRLEEEKSSINAPVEASRMPLESPVKPFETNPAKRMATKESALTEGIAKTKEKLEKEVLSKLNTDLSSAIGKSDKLKDFLKV